MSFVGENNALKIIQNMKYELKRKISIFCWALFTGFIDCAVSFKFLSLFYFSMFEVTHWLHNYWLIWILLWVVLIWSNKTWKCWFSGIGYSFGYPKIVDKLYGDNTGWIFNIELFQMFIIQLWKLYGRSSCSTVTINVWEHWSTDAAFLV